MFSMHIKALILKSIIRPTPNKMSSSRNTYNVANESEQWQKLYRTIESNVRIEIMTDVGAKMDKLKRKNRKLKDQNKCLMEMVAMMRNSAAPRFTPHTPSGLCTPSKYVAPEPDKPACIEKTEEPCVKLENIFIKTEKNVIPSEVIDLTETKVVSIPLSKFENVVCCAVCRCRECICIYETASSIDVSELSEEEEQPVPVTITEAVEEEEEAAEEEEEAVEEEEEAAEEEEEAAEEEEEEAAEEEEEAVETQTPSVEEEEEEAVETQITSVEEEEEEAVEEVVIQGKRYYTSNTTNGEIYDIDEEDNPGDVVGKYVNGVPEFITKDVQPEEEEEEEEQEEEEESVEEMVINNVKYYVTNPRDGTIYEMQEDGDVGDEIGKFVNGKPVFNK